MVHKFNLFGNNIVYDANANSLHVFNGVAAELLDAWQTERGAFDSGAVAATEKKYGPGDTTEATDEIRSLVESGQLFARDEGGPDAASLENSHVFKSLCMHLAHDCNMKCAYCFASEGSFGLERGLMDYETACAAIDFVTKASAGRTNIEIDFFGGEPLLNYDVLKRTVEYARQNEKKHGKKFRFTLTTNGLLLDDDVVDYVNANMDNLVLSIDGRREVNDRLRKRLDGSGTYEYIVDRFLSVTRKRESSWYVRGTYTVLNKDFAADVLHLADLDFDRLSVEPVVSPMDPALGFSPDDLAALSEEYEKLAYAIYERGLQGKPIDFFHFNVDLEGGPCAARRIKGCGAGYEYAAVTPNGDIYPCHQFAGIEQFRLGDVFNRITNHEMVSRMKNNNIYAKPECRACWAKYLCGGGCAANAWYYNHDIDMPDPFYCNLFRKRMECALWLACAQSLQQPL